MFTYTLREAQEQAEVKLEGDLDIDGTSVVDEQLLPELIEYKSVRLNFSQVPFVDSTGMSLLMNMVQTLKEEDIQVTISNVQEDVLDVFELLQIPEILGEEVFV